MACYLAAASHYVNQFDFLISEDILNSPESNFTARAQSNILFNAFKIVYS